MNVPETTETIYLLWLRYDEWESDLRGCFKSVPAAVSAVRAEAGDDYDEERWSVRQFETPKQVHIYQSRYGMGKYAIEPVELKG